MPKLAAIGKRIGRKVVPHGWRPQIRAFYNGVTAPLFAGDRFNCPCCERSFGRWRIYASEAAGDSSSMCPWCGALGRHRVDWLFLRDRTNIMRDPIRLLHVAPEISLGRRFQTLANVDYLSADYDSTLAMERMDIRDIPYPDESFDAVVCNHVLEHVDDDRRALREVHRVLQTGGWAMLQVPLDLSRTTFEDPTVTDPRERTRLFGQYDHVRIYGRDYDERLRRVGFEVETSWYAAEFPDVDIERMGLDRNERVNLCWKRDAHGPDEPLPVRGDASTQHD